MTDRLPSSPSPALPPRPGRLLRWAAVALVMACVQAVPVEARPPDQATIRDLAAADEARTAAMVAADPATVAGYLSEDLRYSHSSGTIDSKKSFLELIGSGRTRYRSYRSLEREFTFAADGVALASGRAAVTIETAAGSVDVVLCYLAVWRLEQGAWRLLAWQSSRLAAEPPVKPR